MKPGTTVCSTINLSKGPGLVIAVKTIFGREYVDVYFEKTREKLTVPADDLVICEPPEVKLQKGLTAAPTVSCCGFFWSGFAS